MLLGKNKYIRYGDISPALFCRGSTLYISKGLSLIHMEALLFPAVLRESVLHMDFLPTDRCYTYCCSKIPKSLHYEGLY